MPLKKKLKVATMYSQADAEKFAEEYNDISLKIKQLNSEKKRLADQLKKCAEMLGVTDDKGSSYIDGDSFVVGRVAKRSVVIDQEKGVAFLRGKGLSQCVEEKTFYTVKESEVEKAVANGDLTQEDIAEFTSVETSYSVSVKAKENMPEVEVRSVAKTKK